MMQRRPLARAATAFAVLATLLAACAGSSSPPGRKGQRTVLLTEADDVRVGREQTGAVAAEMGVLDDPALEAYINGIGRKLLRGAPVRSYDYQFKIVDQTEPNAFALPGGFIYVTRGILAYLNSEAQLAGVVGHEIGHVTARHAAQQITKQALAQLGLAAGSIASPSVGQYANLASGALGVLFLKYSRDAERQADDLGLRYMERAGYDARALPGVFGMLGRVTSAAGGDRMPGWLATHPDPGDRRERITKELAAVPAESLGTRVDRDAYLRRIEGLVVGTDLREGYFKGSRFVHPGLGFEITFPDGWTQTNERKAVTALALSRDAVIEVSGASQSTPDSAARGFLGQRGVQGRIPALQVVNGLPTATSEFGATTSDGATVRGTIVCVTLAKNVFRLVGYGLIGRWPDRRDAVTRSLATFRALTDSAELATEPPHIVTFALERDATIAELATQRPSPLKPAALALLNQVDTTSTLTAGTRIKWVAGGRRP